MRQTVKKGISVFLLLAALYFFQPKAPTPFSPEFIAYDFQKGTFSFDCPELAELKEPLDYIGNGGQAIAFSAPNSPYVIKFFLAKQLSDRRWIELPSLRQFLPAFRLAKEKRLSEQRENTLQTLSERYERAFRDLKEETGLIALHCRATMGGLPHCTIRDKKGRIYRIDLNRASFVIQKKAKPLSHLTPKERLAAKGAIERLLEVRAIQGYTDLRRAFNQNNFGLLNGRAIMIDPGSILFSEEQKNSPEGEIQRMKNLLRGWLGSKNTG